MMSLVSFLTLFLRLPEKTGKMKFLVSFVLKGEKIFFLEKASREDLCEKSCQEDLLSFLKIFFFVF